MPWRTTDVLEQRKLFITRWLLCEESFSELCEEFGIPRKTGYKWRDRYLREGFPGLSDMSRRPKNFRDQIPNEVILEILRIKKWRPTWGARTIRAYLWNAGTFASLPHARSIDRYLKRAGYVTPRGTGWKGKYSPEEITQPTAPNDVWSVDHKGWWRTRDGKQCTPLTMMDRYSRMLLNLSSHRTPNLKETICRFTEVFEEFGLPLVVRMDNGAPFASVRGLHRLTRFSVWLMKLGVVPNRMNPASPSQNGSHERTHRDIKRELQSDPAGDLMEEQQRFDPWRYEHNHIRPKEVLGGKTPSQLYEKSPRKFNSKVEFEYPADFELRKVSANGDISWTRSPVGIAKSLAGEYIGIEDVGEPELKVWLYDFCLGTLSRKNPDFTPSQSLVRAEIGRRVT